MFVDVVPYRLPLRRAFTTAAGVRTARTGWLVAIADGDGHRGWGEAAPLPGHGGEAPEAVPAALDALARAVADPDARRLILGTPPGWAPLHALSARLMPRADATPCARAAVEGALADLLARRAGLPLARWLSRAARADVPLNAVIDAVDPAAAAAAAVSAVAAGYGTLKLKLTADAAADDARLRAVRGAVGHGVALRGDANGAWTAETAIERLRGLAAYDLAYVEQPVAAADLAGLARVRRASDVPIAADEALLWPAGPGIAAVLAAEAADVVVLKPALMGGPTAARAAALAAAGRGVGVTVTTSLDAAVGRHIALAVAAALDAAPGACGLATGALLAADVGPDLSIAAGRAAVDLGSPGIGFEPDVTP